MVSHDPQIAARAGRRLRVLDGVVTDTTNQAADDVVAASPVVQQMVSAQSLEKLNNLAGVQQASIMVVHSQSAISATPFGALTSELPPYTVVGMVSGSVPNELFEVETGGSPVQYLGEDEVVVGGQLAAQIGLGPILASPIIWVDGGPFRVVGILEDSGLQVALLNSVLMNEDVAAEFSEISYALAEIRVDPGAAAQVALQAPVAWIPAAPEKVAVDAPPDPTTMREQIEGNLSTMLLTLTGVALLAAVISLAGSMTMAVFQRAGEFGLRRAIGARRKHVTLLVLTESLVIGALGGILGAYHWGSWVEH